MNSYCVLLKKKLRGILTNIAHHHLAIALEMVFNASHLVIEAIPSKYIALSQPLLC